MPQFPRKLPRKDKPSDPRDRELDIEFALVLGRLDIAESPRGVLNVGQQNEHGFDLASVGSGQPGVTRWSGPFSLICALIGICALLVAIPLLLPPFTLPGAYLIAALEFVLLVLAVRFHTF